MNHDETMRMVALVRRLQKAGEVIHLVCERFEDLTGELSRLRQDEAEIRVASNVTGRLIRSRDFH